MVVVGLSFIIVGLFVVVVVFVVKIVSVVAVSQKAPLNPGSHLHFVSYKLEMST